MNNHTDLLASLLERETELKNRISALETVLVSLAAGYNPNYQDMAVLEAVRGWDALKDGGEAAETEEGVEEGQAETSEEVEELPEWTDERINELKNKDPLSALLEHEQHIGATASEDFASLRELIYLLPSWVPYNLIRVQFSR